MTTTILLLFSLLACAPTVGEAETPHEACMDYYAAACSCGGDDCLRGAQAAEACAYLEESACVAGDEQACAHQDVGWQLLDEWNCYNAVYAETCDSMTDECWAG